MHDAGHDRTAEHKQSDAVRVHRLRDEPPASSPTSSAVQLVAFDLDGTVLRGDTVCQAIARRMGHLPCMNQIEQLREPAAIAAARSELARYYQLIPREELVSHVAGCRLAPGAEQGLSLLRAHGIVIAFVSITWSFGVEWFARQLGADYWVGTDLSETGEVTHFWPQDKPIWLAKLMHELNVSPDHVAAVGDSSGDVALLDAVTHRFYVGRDLPPGLVAKHRPDGNILAIAREIVSPT